MAARRRTYSRQLKRLHPALMITRRGAGALILLCACMLGASALASRVLAATAVALLAALAAGLVQVTAGARLRALADAQPTPAGGIRGAKGAAGLDAADAPLGKRLQHKCARAFAPHAWRLDAAWEQLDQHGQVVDMVPPEEAPRKRGWYRLPAGVSRLRDCFGFWRRDVPVVDDAERIVPPAPTSSPRLERALLRATGAATDVETLLDTAQVRPYEPGDPLRSIAWRQSAHHGTFMSFETRQQHAQTPIVVADTLSPTDADALAAHTYTCWLTLRRGVAHRGTPIVTDGVQCHTTTDDVIRFVAALEVDAPNDPAALSQTAEARAHEIWRQVRQAGSGALLVLITPDATGPLARALRAALPRTPLVTVAPNGDAGVRDIWTARDDGVPRSEEAPNRYLQRRAAGQAADTTPLAFDILAALACAGSLALALSAASSLIKPATWLTTSYVTFTSAALIAVLARRLPGGQRFGIRTLIRSVALLAIGVGTVLVARSLVTDALGIDVIAHPELAEQLGEYAHFAPGPITAMVVQGICDVYMSQWVPLTLDAVADAAFTLLIAGAGGALVLVLTSLSLLRPACALLALASFVARTTLLGLETPAWWIAAACASLLVLIACDAWLLDGEGPVDAPAHLAPRRARKATSRSHARYRTSSRRLPIAAVTTSCLAAVIALSGANAALNLAARIPLTRPTGTTDLLTTTTVNPLVDLRQSLERGNEAVALTYTTTARRPLYLKLATLNNFDGTTWRLDDALTTQGTANIPLIGALLAPTSTDAAALPGTQVEDTPLGNSATAEATRGNSDLSIQTEVTIDNLVSRFAPVPSGTWQSWPGTLDQGASGSGLSADEVSSIVRESDALGDWAWSEDNTIYGTASTTYDGMTYVAESLYLTPATTRTLFAQNVEAAEDALAASGNAEEAGQTDSIASRYLAVPDNLPPAFAATLRELIGSTSWQATTLSDEIAAVSTLIWHFVEDPYVTYTYSLDVDPGDGTNLEALGTFLTERRGYCAQYAASFTLLARMMGVPARMVVGYRADTSNEEASETATKTYAVTNHDLHAWSEVYLAGIGWMPVDVTPSSAGSTNTATAPADDTTEAPDTPDAAETPETPAPSEPAGENRPEQDTDASPSASNTAFDALRSALEATGAAVARALPYVAGGATIIALLATPKLLRRHRRTRRLRVIHAALEDGAAGRQASVAPQTSSQRDADTGAQRSQTLNDISATSWRAAAHAAWDEIIDQSLDAGATFARTATEEDVTRQLASLMAANPTQARALNALEQAICSARYAGASAAGDAKAIALAFHEVDGAFSRPSPTTAHPDGPQGPQAKPRSRHFAPGQATRHAQPHRLTHLMRRLFPRSVMRRLPQTKLRLRHARTGRHASKPRARRRQQ